jgi:hypothetical protein
MFHITMEAFRRHSSRKDRRSSIEALRYAGDRETRARIESKLRSARRHQNIALAPSRRTPMP